MTLPPMLEGDQIKKRLVRIFPIGTPDRNYVIRDIAVKTVYVMMYIGAIEGEARWLAPQHIYSMGDAQAAESSMDARDAYYVNVPKRGKGKYVPIGEIWYATNTRESIRDETLRDGLISLGAVITSSDVPQSSSRGRYALSRAFADLLNPDLKDDALGSAILHWQDAHLTAAARARVQAGRTVGNTHSVTVHLPQGISRQMDAGMSSEITKAVAEVFAPHFLKQPVVVWISESGKKVAPFDQEFTQALNLNIEARKVLPDMILMDLGIPFRLVFVEVVATNGPVTEDRKAALTKIARQGGYKEDDLVFVTAYHDRGSTPFKSTVSRLAWGTFAWFSNEPEQLLVMDSGKENLRLTLDGVGPSVQVP